MSFYSRLRDLWLDTFGKTRPRRPSPRKIEIARIEAALVRYNARLEEMDRQWADSGGICCPGCMFGREYTALTDKIERVEKWLKILRSRGPP